MEITLSKYSGFCPGVQNADKIIRSLLSGGGRIFTLGKLIHNRLYNENLERLGVRSITLDEISDRYNEAPDVPMHLVIRTHGIPREDEEILRSFAEEHSNFHYVDATCAFVKNIHKIADENTDENTYFLLFADPTHPEAIGTMSYARGKKMMFSSIYEIENLDFVNKTPILCAQTTQNLVEFKKK